jgi:hypothetical protein
MLGAFACTKLSLPHVAWWLCVVRVGDYSALLEGELTQAGADEALLELAVDTAVETVQQFCGKISQAMGSGAEAYQLSGHVNNTQMLDVHRFNAMSAMQWHIGNTMRSAVLAAMKELAAQSRECAHLPACLSACLYGSPRLGTGHCADSVCVCCVSLGASASSTRSRQYAFASIGQAQDGTEENDGDSIGAALLAVLREVESEVNAACSELVAPLFSSMRTALEAKLFAVHKQKFGETARGALASEIHGTLRLLQQPPQSSRLRPRCSCAISERTFCWLCGVHVNARVGVHVGVRQASRDDREAPLPLRCNEPNDQSPHGRIDQPPGDLRDATLVPRRHVPVDSRGASASTGDRCGAVYGAFLASAIFTTVQHTTTSSSFGCGACVWLREVLLTIVSCWLVLLLTLSLFPQLAVSGLASLKIPELTKARHACAAFKELLFYDHTVRERKQAGAKLLILAAVPCRAAAPITVLGCVRVGLCCAAYGCQRVKACGTADRHCGRLCLHACIAGCGRDMHAHWHAKAHSSPNPPTPPPLAGTAVMVQPTTLPSAGQSSFHDSLCVRVGAPVHGEGRGSGDLLPEARRAVGPGAVDGEPGLSPAPRKGCRSKSGASEGLPRGSRRGVGDRGRQGGEGSAGAGRRG